MNLGQELIYGLKEKMIAMKELKKILVLKK
jgi:hypothetical protein